jgi:CHAT domain-containing protein/tetratricopeptide (TPR) repeat protein
MKARILFVGLLHCLLAPPLSVAQDGKVEERDRLAEEVETLIASGQYKDALLPAAKVAGLAREAFGKNHPETAKAVLSLAELHELTADWSGAATYRQEVANLWSKRSGEKHWRSVGAKVALTFARKGSRLSRDDQLKLTAALRTEREAYQLLMKGRAGDAVVSADSAVREMTDLVGKDARVGRCLWLLGLARQAHRDVRGASDAYGRNVELLREAYPAGHPDLGMALFYIGRSQYTQNDNKAALKSLGEAVKAWSDFPDLEDLTFAGQLMIAGNILRELNDLKGARNSFETAAAIRRRAADTPPELLAESLNNLGNIQFELKDYAGSRKSHEEALAIRRKQTPRNDREVGRSLCNLANVRHAQGDLAAARQLHEEGLAVRRKALGKDHPDVSESLYNLGVVQNDLGDYKAARESYTEALAIRQEHFPDSDPYISRIVSNLGGVSIELGNFPLARKHFEKALDIEIRRPKRDIRQLSKLLYNLGNLEQAVGEYASARRYYERGLTLRKRFLPEGHAGIADGWNRLGNAQYELRDYREARRSYREALDIALDGHPADHLTIAQYWRNLGLAEGRLWNYEQAGRCHQEALSIRQMAKPLQPLAVAQSLEDLGHAEAIHLGNAESARKRYEEALALQRKHQGDNRDIASCLCNLACAQLYLKDYAAARATAEQAVTTCRKELPRGHPDLAYPLFVLGQTLVVNSKTAEAVPVLTEAVELLQDQSRLLALGQGATEQLATVEGYRPLVKMLVGAVVEARADPSELYSRIVHLKGSVTAYQQWARLARDTKDETVADLLTQLRECNRILLGAATVLSKTGGHKKIDELAGAQMDTDSRPFNILVESKGSMAQVERQTWAFLMQQFTGIRADLERRLAESSEDYRKLMSRGKVTADSVRTALPKGTALIDMIEYWVPSAPGLGKAEKAERWTAAFVVRPDREKITLVSLGRSDELEELINRWLASHGAGKLPPVGQADPAARLREMLWQPVEKSLRGVVVVLLSPDGPLHGLPWAALPGARKGTFLIQEHAFATVPVPLMLPRLLRDGRIWPERPSSLAVGGADFGTAAEVVPMPGRQVHYSNLPETATEARMNHDLFRKTFPRGEAALLLGKEATKQAFLKEAPSRNHLLVATHGFFAPLSKEEQTAQDGSAQGKPALLFGQNPLIRTVELRSGLVFAEANRTETAPEAYLTALEVSDLDLRKVDLAVLSACETGLGKAEWAQGVFGLQRAFQVAGARTVLASLWSVEDSATRMLMTEFYRNLWEKKLPKAEALRQAQLHMIRNVRYDAGSRQVVDLRGGGKRIDDSEARRKLEEQLARLKKSGEPLPPFFWAAFVLSGDWR